MKKLLTLFITLVMLTTLAGCGSKINVIEKEVNTKDGLYKNQTVILHTNDVHGAIEGYSYLPPLKKALEEQGATVILVDAGDFTSGTIYTSASKGESAVTLMNQVGYDLATLGNHEFDYSVEQLLSNLKNATFTTICTNLVSDKQVLFNPYTIVKVGDLKIGFVGVATPETLTKANPEYTKGLSILSDEELFKNVQERVNEVRKEADLVICLTHLGIDDESIGHRSYDLVNNVEGIDFVIDGHSHTVMIHGENGEPIQSTGTAFENIGTIVIDNETKKIVKNELVPTADLEQDTDVLATAKNVIETVDADYAKVFAKSEVDLNGIKEEVRSQETNLGDLVMDAAVWSATNELEMKVDADHIVGVVNGGCIRASIEKGDVTKKQVFNVLPFGNTISVDYLKGSELLEALEASVFMAPEAAGGFPQVSNMKIQIDLSKEFDPGELYPNSTYFAPKSIQRVTILEINGKPFNPDDTYAVVTSNFVAAGGDTYYAFKRSRLDGNTVDTPVTLYSAVMNYITTELGGVVGSEYEKPQGRITIIGN